MLKLTQNVKHSLVFVSHNKLHSLISGNVEESLYHVSCTCGWEKVNLFTEATARQEGNIHLQQQVSNVKKLIYLASPHSHTNAAIREDRYKAALDCTEWLFRNRFWVFSPIVHSHLFYGKLDQGLGWDFWVEYDTEMITRCDELWVLMIPGWKESKGVQAEVKIAKLQGKKVFGIVPKWGEKESYVVEEFME